METLYESLQKAEEASNRFWEDVYDSLLKHHLKYIDS